jgi:TatA/E family protein of Tat protein translocase
MPFNIGLPEVILILAIALIVLGPKRLPEVGSSLGKALREFRHAVGDVQEATSLEPKPAAAPLAPQPNQLAEAAPPNTLAEPAPRAAAVAMAPAAAPATLAPSATEPEQPGA